MLMPNSSQQEVFSCQRSACLLLALFRTWEYVPHNDWANSSLIRKVFIKSPPSSYSSLQGRVYMQQPWRGFGWCDCCWYLPANQPIHICSWQLIITSYSPSSTFLHDFFCRSPYHWHHPACWRRLWTGWWGGWWWPWWYIWISAMISIIWPNNFEDMPQFYKFQGTLGHRDRYKFLAFKPQQRCLVAYIPDYASS